MEVLVHKRVTERHPELSESDVVHAWEHAFAAHRRNGSAPDVILAAGADLRGRVIEMLAAELPGRKVLVFHAMLITRSVIRELGL